jgi:hypothetical protein
MNYDMQGMEMIPELLAVLKTAKVEIKKEHQVLMVEQDHWFQEGQGLEGKLHEWQTSCRSSEGTQG